MIEKYQLSKMYPDAEFNIVMFNEELIGRFYINYGEEFYHIIEIGLLELYRVKGIGKKIMNMTIEKALKSEKNVSIQVPCFNQEVYNFYERLGFKTIKNNDAFCEMKYMP